MKITYSKEGYQILLEYPETEIYINANNIIDARKHFIDMMTFAFDSTVNEQFQKTFDDALENVEKICSDIPYAVVQCVSDVDHDWECCGLSSGGDEYRCRKCGIRRTFPLSYSVSTTISGN